MDKYIVVVAGGKGLRMGGELPKQFIEIKGKPILMHTIERFFDFDNSIKIILVLPESHFAFWNELIDKYKFTIPHTLIKGGETRFHSVKNGLSVVPEFSLVGIHDGVRPLVSNEVIERTYNEALLKGGAIPVVDVVDSLRQIDSSGKTFHIERSAIKIVQTPQVFLSDILLTCYDVPYSEFFTDDASIFEANGNTISCVEGNRENIKITTPFDLKIAEILL